MGDRFEAVAMALGGGRYDDAGPSGAHALPLELRARMVGAYQWIERRLFEVLGGWAGGEAVPEAQIVFDVYSQQHAWHAELLAERLPALDAVDPDTLTVPPSVEVDRMLAVLAGAVRPGAGDPDAGADTAGGALSAGGTLQRLVGLGRVVLPRLVTGYGLHLRRLSPVADAALGRCLTLVLRDEVEQWQAVETLTQALLRRPHDIAVVTAYQQGLEQIVAESGTGLVTWPEVTAPPAVPAPEGGAPAGAPPPTPPPPSAGPPPPVSPGVEPLPAAAPPAAPPAASGPPSASLWRPAPPPPPGPLRPPPPAS